MHIVLIWPPESREAAMDIIARLTHCNSKQEW